MSLDLNSFIKLQAKRFGPKKPRSKRVEKIMNLTLYLSIKRALALPRVYTSRVKKVVMPKKNSFRVSVQLSFICKLVIGV